MFVDESSKEFILSKHFLNDPLNNVFFFNNLWWLIITLSLIAGYFKLMELFLSHIQSNSEKSEPALTSLYDWMKRYCEQVRP